MSDNMVTLLRAAELRIQSEAQQIAASAQIAGPDAASAASPANFSDAMQAALHSVNAQDVDAGQRMAAVESGESDDLVGAMVASQEASLSFSMLMQVRNKVAGALDELIKLPL